MHLTGKSAFDAFVIILLKCEAPLPVHFFRFAFPCRREISFQVYPSLCYNRIPQRARKVRGGAICKAYYRKQPARVLFAGNSNTPYK
jgi:hypothetical protein